MQRLTFLILLLIIFFLGSCRSNAREPVLTPIQSSPQPVLPTPLSPTPLPPTLPIDTPTVITATPLLAAETPAPDLPAESEEEIMILQPGPGSSVTSPFTVSGYAGPAPDQNLIIRIIDDEGREVAFTSTTIMAESGMRGVFSQEVTFSVSGDRQGFIQVYTESPRDGRRTHLTSVGLVLSETGPEEILSVTPYPERIAIFLPREGDTVSGGVVRVEGFGLAGFEQTLIVAIQDEQGNVLSMEPVMVRAPDLGYHGPFEIILYYTVSHSQNGRVVVSDQSPAHGDDAHLSSVEVILEP
jgi:hypothetical protein